LDLPEDRNLSPYTGWTRERWTSQADHLLDSLKPYASPSFSRIELPGRNSRSGPDSDALEGFARTFMLAAWRIAGERGQGPIAAELIARYSAGLAAGADAGHPEAWPRIAPGRPTQPMVEAASIALGLHETREWLWNKLDPRTQGLVADWLGEFVGNFTWANNWMLFQTVVEEFLASIGAKHDELEITRGLAATDGWYVGDGWYTDGTGRNFDYYIGWAMHLYPLMWTRMAAGGARSDRAAEMREVYRDRLRQFLTRYFDFFGADGAPVHQGRSLTYRFAAAAPIWVGEMFDCSPYDSGLSRRAASGVLKYFAEHGAPDERGLLSLGWHGEFLPMVQTYSGPASPYWASKGFIGLVLPAEHRVWTAEEQPLPVEQGDFESAIEPVGWLLSGTKRDGIVRLLNHGSDKARDHTPPYYERDEPHYSPLAFSTATAPDVAPEAWARRIGNHLALLTLDGVPTRRGIITPIGTGLGGAAEGRGGWAASRFVPSLPGGPEDSLLPVEGTEVETRSEVYEGLETRSHRVTAPAGWTVREGGYPVADGTGLLSTITPVDGWTGSGIDEAVDANAFGTRTVTPYLTAVHPGGTVTYVSRVRLTTEAEADQHDADGHTAGDHAVDHDAADHDPLET
jgi:hypothetical protein